jgi:hypothetical protein
VLAPAVDAEARQAEEEWNEEKFLNAGRQKATTSQSKTTTVSKGRDGSGTLTGSHGSGGAKAVGLESSGKKDEGGFDGPNASFGDVDIGGKDDPGRLAEEKFERQNAQFDGGHGARDMGIEAETGRFDALKDDAE